VNELTDYFAMIEGYDNPEKVSLDRAHNLFIVSSILAKKPDDILEIGVGRGFVTVGLIIALKYNRKGRLTCVDNWIDYRFAEPPGIDEYRSLGATVVNMPEEQFVRQAPTDGWDVLISDADHKNSHLWLDETLRIVRNGGFMFFHDTNQPELYPGLSRVEQSLTQRGIFCTHFRQSSRPDEQCHRGLLFAVNVK
jgi:predicted O-methyltransferase YrrM